MSQENVEIVRDAYRRFAAGDLDGVAKQISPDAEMPDAGGLGVAGSAAGMLRGPEGLIRAAGEAQEAFEEYSIEVEDCIDGGAAVIALVRISGKGRLSGVELVMRLAHVWVLDDAGKVIRGEVYRTRAEALEAVGLTE